MVYLFFYSLTPFPPFPLLSFPFFFPFLVPFSLFSPFFYSFLPPFLFFSPFFFSPRGGHFPKCPPPGSAPGCHGVPVADGIVDSAVLLLSKDCFRKLMAPWLPTAAFMLSKNPNVIILTFWKSPIFLFSKEPSRRYKLTTLGECSRFWGAWVGGVLTRCSGSAG